MADDFFSGLDEAVETLRLGSTSERLTALVKLSSELVTALDAQQALITVGEAVRHLVGGERFLAIDADELVVVARDGDGVDLPLPPEFCRELSDVAAATGEVQFVYLPSKHLRFAQTMSAQPYVGMIAVPLMAKRGCRGAVYVDSRSTFIEALEPALAEVLLLLGSHAADVMENAAVLARVNTDATSELQTAPYFERRLADELKRSTRYQRPFSLLFVEIQNADACLSRYGQGGLDLILSTLGSVLKSECREPDILARVGPARLAILCPELGVGEHEQLRVVPKELGLRWHKKTALASFKIGDVPQKIKLHIGGVSYQRPSVLGAKGVMHEAELALQVAKRENEDHYLVR